MRRLSAPIAALLAAALLATPASARAFPQTIPLPDGFQPEGIAVGRGTTFYVGSIPTGAIYRGDLRTGEGSLLVAGREGAAAIGLAYDRGRLFVAGGATGKLFVYDAATGALLAELALGEGFVNDVIVTREAAYLTNSFDDEYYAVPLAPGGAPTGEVHAVALGGDFTLVQGFNLNGIVATPDGETLLAVQSQTGLLYALPAGGSDARVVDLGEERLRNGDGLLLQGRTLSVVRNRDNLVAVVELAPDLSSGAVVAHLDDVDFRTPTTLARHGRRLYAVNARFGTPSPETADYDVVLVG